MFAFLRKPFRGRYLLFLRKPFRGTGWGLRAPTPAPTLSGKSRQKAAARRLRQKPLNAGLGRGDAQSAYFGRGLGLPLRVGLSGVRPNPRAKPAGVFACASYCRCWERRSGVRISPCACGWGGWDALGYAVSPRGRSPVLPPAIARRGSRGLPLVVSRGLRGVQRGLRGEIEIPPGPSGPSGAGWLPLYPHRPHPAHVLQSAKENATHREGAPRQSGLPPSQAAQPALTPRARAPRRKKENQCHGRLTPPWH